MHGQGKYLKRFAHREFSYHILQCKIPVAFDIYCALETES